MEICDMKGKLRRKYIIIRFIYLFLCEVALLNCLFTTTYTAIEYRTFHINGVLAG